MATGMAVASEHWWGSRREVNYNWYDGREGRPAAHLVLAWPHGVNVVDAMVDAFHADGNMSVVSLVNAEMHNATELGACIYATEKSTRAPARASCKGRTPQANRRAGRLCGDDIHAQTQIKQKMVCRAHLPSPCLHRPFPDSLSLAYTLLRGRRARCSCASERWP